MITSAALYTLLISNAQLVALVGQRIYPALAPQDASAPYIVWQRIATNPIQTLGEATGNQFDLIQLSCFALTYESADAVAQALVTALDGRVVTTNDNATLQSRRESYEPAVDLYRSDCDFLI